MESIEKLRMWSHRYDNGWIQEDGSIVITTDTHGVCYGENYGESIRAMIDEIEAEIVERYIELPVDADGVPIRVGEDVVRTNDRSQLETVCVIGIGGRSVFFKHDGRIKQNVAHNLHHAKPCTLEDVLREFTDEVIEWSGYSGPVSGDRTWSGMAAKYVDEIRELLGGDAK